MHTNRRAACILALAGLLASAPAVAAHPDTPATLTYHFTNCTGPAGTPDSFDAVKQPSGSAALHLVDDSGIFIAVQAIDVETGTVLFSTPGFFRNDLPTVACRVVHPVTGATQSVIGLIVPVG